MVIFLSGVFFENYSVSHFLQKMAKMAEFFISRTVDRMKMFDPSI